jgi:hypothetical protein
VSLHPEADITTKINPEDMEVFRHAEARKGDLKRPAVRQAGLLAYKLAGDQTREETKIMRWFEHVNQFGKPGANDVLGRFSRDTKWVAAGLLGAVFFAALAFAALVPERYPKIADPTREASQTKPSLSLNADAATLFKIVDLNAKVFASEATSQAVTHVDQKVTEDSSKASVVGMEAGAASTPPPFLVSSLKINHINTRTNAGRWSPRYGQDSTPGIKARFPQGTYRSSGRLRDVDVKMRLIALWHQSLLRSEKARTWAIYSNLNTKKKAAYTAGKEP